MSTDELKDLVSPSRSQHLFDIESSKYEERVCKRTSSLVEGSDLALFLGSNGRVRVWCDRAYMWSKCRFEVKLVESIVKKLALTKYLSKMSPSWSILRKKLKVLVEAGKSIRLVMNCKMEVFVMYTSNKDSLSTAQVAKKK